MKELFLIALSYLIGSVSFACLISQAFKRIDVRKVGDRNAGTANVLRHVGLAAAFLVIVADISKGAAAILIAQYFSGNQLVVFASGIATVLGHARPIFFRFKGGRGVATTIGIFTALMPIPTLSLLAISGLIALKTKNMTLAISFLLVSVLLAALLTEKPLLLGYFFFLSCLLWLVSFLSDKNLSNKEIEESKHI